MGLERGQVLAEVGGEMVMGGWLKNWGGGIRDWGSGPDLLLAVMEEKQTDLTVTNEPSPLPQLPVLFFSNSGPTFGLLSCPSCSFHSEYPQSISSSFSPADLFNSSYFFLLDIYLYLYSFSPWCSLTCVPPIITFVVHLKNQLILAHNNYFFASVSCHYGN